MERSISAQSANSMPFPDNGAFADMERDSYFTLLCALSFHLINFNPVMPCQMLVPFHVAVSYV
jgi:hypothetical protein